MTLKAHQNYGIIASIQFNLSDGTKSPIIKTQKGTNYDREKTIYLDPRRPVKFVAASDNNHSHVYNIKFIDIEGRLIDDFNLSPIGISNQNEHEIGLNEEIIGCYGVDDQSSGAFFT